MSLASLERKPIVPILPPKGEPELVGRSVYLPAELWERLRDIAEQTKAEDPHGKGYSRNEVIIHFLSWAADQYDLERSQGKKAKK